MIAEIQCLPSPAGHAPGSYEHIEAAIAVVVDSGLDHEVGALGTTVEGDADEVWAVLRRAHEATLASGATGAVTVVKVAEQATSGPTMAELVSPHR